jgi:hypothetical protein
MKPSWYLIALLGLFLITQSVTAKSTIPVAVSTNPTPVLIASQLVGPTKSWDWQLAKANYEEQLKLQEIERLRLEEVARIEAERIAAEQKKIAEEKAKKPVVAAASNTRRYTNDTETAEIQTLIESRWPGQWNCLDQLVAKESGWRVNAYNPSGAYGLPQALPGSKMASAGADWETNPVTQIKWMMGYIEARYTDPCGAWGFQQANNWY